MIIDAVTSVQYAGLLRNYIEQRKINPNEEERIKNILEEERKRVQPIEEAIGKKVNILI